MNLHQDREDDARSSYYVSKCKQGEVKMAAASADEMSSTEENEVPF